MVEISLSGSGEGPGWVTAPGYSTVILTRKRRLRAILERRTKRRSQETGPCGAECK